MSLFEDFLLHQNKRNCILVVEFIDFMSTVPQEDRVDYDKILKLVIAKSPFCILRYAQKVLEGRWPEAEPVVLTDLRTANDYRKAFVKGRWPEFEKVILAYKRIDGLRAKMAYTYSLEVLKESWLKAEKYILQDGFYSLAYAGDFKFRWPEAERKHRKLIQLELSRTSCSCFRKVILGYFRNCVKERWDLIEELHAKGEIHPGAWSSYRKFLRSKP